MASVSTNKKGLKRIQFFDAAGERKSIWLGRMTDRQADLYREQIEAIVFSQKTGDPLPIQTEQWVHQRAPAFKKKLEKAGLIEIEVQEEAACAMLGDFIECYILGRGDVKAATGISYSNAERNLKTFFGADAPLNSITPARAEEWRNWLKSHERLAPNTIRRRTGIARQFFRAAAKRGLIAENPFEGLAASVRENTSRFYFVTPEETRALIDTAPDSQWRLLIALARYGGLRMPSEVLPLAWDDVDWDRGRFTVHSSKTEHHAGGGSRSVPLFPELLPYMREAFEMAEDGATHVITRYRDATQNLRTTLGKIIKRAGLKPWPKLWQNMRSSRQSELVAEFPVHVVCKWLGNSPVIAAKHYLQVTEDDFQRAATEATMKPAPTSKSSAKSGALAAAPSGTARQAAQAALSKTASHDGARRLEYQMVGEAGLEPAHPCG